MASEAPPLSIPPPAMSTLNVFPDEDENEDEWEYEYSATEYEVIPISYDHKQSLHIRHTMLPSTSQHPTYLQSDERANLLIGELGVGRTQA
jgi:hypothetical protein